MWKRVLLTKRCTRYWSTRSKKAPGKTDRGRHEREKKKSFSSREGEKKKIVFSVRHRGRFSLSLEPGSIPWQRGSWLTVYSRSCLRFWDCGTIELHFLWGVVRDGHWALNSAAARKGNKCVTTGGLPFFSIQIRCAKFRSSNFHSHCCNWIKREEYFTGLHGRLTAGHGPIHTHRKEKILIIIHLVSVIFLFLFLQFKLGRATRRWITGNASYFLFLSFRRRDGMRNISIYKFKEFFLFFLDQGGADIKTKIWWM